MQVRSCERSMLPEHFGDHLNWCQKMQRAGMKCHLESNHVRLSHAVQYGGSKRLVGHANLYAKCMSISRRQLPNSMGVAAGSKAAGGVKSGRALYTAARPAAAGVVRCPRIAFQWTSSAINEIAPVVSHCGHRPQAFALRSSYHSLTSLRGSSARKNLSNTVGWMDGWMDRLLITTVDALNVERIERML